MLSISGFAYANEDDTEAVALSSGHQAGITKGNNINSAPAAPFGGYSNVRRGDREKAEELLNEIRGLNKTSDAQSKSTD